MNNNKKKTKKKKQKKKKTHKKKKTKKNRPINMAYLIWADWPDIRSTSDSPYPLIPSRRRRMGGLEPVPPAKGRGRVKLSRLQQIPHDRTCDLYWLGQSKQADNDGEVYAGTEGAYQQDSKHAGIVS